MSSDIAIRADQLCKRYQLFDRPLDRLKQMLVRGRRRYYREFTALENVSFELRHGEVLGLIGRNGAGKSTLLQLICGTLNPSSGQVAVQGRVAALLELGAGFNPEFSGRENIYLNASVLGLSKAEIDARYASIVDFAGIGDFIEQPVKTYSSGKYVRLAFSIATSVDPDILIVEGLNVLQPARRRSDGSTALAVSGQRHATWDTDLGEALYRVPLHGRITALTSTDLALFAPSVSPDGSRIASLGTDQPQVSPKNAMLAVASRTGARLSWVTTGLDRTFAPTSGVRAPVWESATTLLAMAEDRGDTHLMRCFADGSTPQPLTSGRITVSGFDHAGGVTVVVAGAVDRVPDVCVLDGAELRRLTAFGERYAAAAKPQPWEKFTVACADGSDEIDAWIMRPARFKATTKYPVLLNVHGGPFTQYGERLFDEAQMQAAAGFVVVMCNPRGSSGRTEAWGQTINGPQHPVAPGTGWGTVDADDVMAVLGATLKRYRFCDPKRVGMLGGSYGGYMATWLATTTGNTFKGICSERAVNNMLTEEWTSDIASFFRTEMGPTHVDDPSEYVRMSPVHQVRDITVPMLLIHSEQDLRCPISQAEELWVAMKLLGKDVTFYRFPGETHELTRSGSPVHRVQRAALLLDWFADRLAG